MFGPGEYIPDPTEGIVNANDLPQPLVVPYDRNHDHSPCPRCGHFTTRQVPAVALGILDHGLALHELFLIQKTA